MPLQDFINKHTGVKCGDTNANYGQCVGLIEVWFDTFGLPHIWGNAVDLGKDADRNAFDVLPNTPDFVPQPGDVFYTDATWGGGYGHTGIVTRADLNTFDAFEQNNPLNSAPRLVHHASYKGIVGFIRRKGATPVPNGEPAMTHDQEVEAYQIVLGRTPSPQEVSGRTGFQFILDAQGELKADRDAAAKQIADLQAQVASGSANGTKWNSLKSLIKELIS